MGRSVTRIMPDAPPQAFKSYAITAPADSHFRRATCEEVGCFGHEFGWITKVDESTELGQKQAWYIRNQSGRRYSEERDAALTTFTFAPGQTCFRPHRIRLDRPAIFSVRNGDWRDSTRPFVHASAEDWVDDFSNHQDQIADLRQKG